MVATQGDDNSHKAWWEVLWAAITNLVGGALALAVVGGLFYLVLGSMVGDPIGWVPALLQEPDRSESPSVPPRPTSQEAVAEEQPAAESQPVFQQEPVFWQCYWDPTMNENWHDDVLCRRGSERIRPILLPHDNFITKDEIMAAAHGYENELNS